VTVICTDFQDFTGIANTLSPEELVQLLDEYFQAFDTITTKFGVEKIKTMGDAYMCAGGLPDPSEGAPIAVMQAAIAMRDFVIDLRNKKMQQGLPFFNCRIGVHTGPVIAGIVGSKKFVYDIWGDTVNTATRMEQYGAIDKINVSEATHELLVEREEVAFDYRGVLEVKGKGGTGMYFVK
jgi:class 3 adenylate cyclase